MDTRFWGPSGWRLLHLITFAYEPAQEGAVSALFESLPFVLPCKFCRASLTEYMEKDVPNYTSSEKLSRWLWRIHNAVNAKLRGQGLLHETDPSYEDVKKVYEERLAAGCLRTEFEGWDFLFSVAENHPCCAAARKSSPLPVNLTRKGRSTPSYRNRENTMSVNERMKWYMKFWKNVGPSLPFAEWRDSWAECKMRLASLDTRKAWLRELWRIRSCIENKLELINRDEFGSLCKRLANHRSGCGKKKRARTCRKSR